MTETIAPVSSILPFLPLSLLYKRLVIFFRLR